MKQDDSGQLSLDFLIGFTIFLIGFIIVVTMASGLLVSLMSKTIDYDAVAYRSGVILVEDPGWARDPVSNLDTSQWELINPARKDLVYRTGLAISKNYPGILTEAKINEFFILSENDIHKKVLFDTPVSRGGPSLFPYRYNISLRSIEADILQKETGDDVPAKKDTGYMKRMVKIKQPSYANITPANVSEGNETPTGEYIVYLNMTDLYKYDPLHRIDPLNENISIRLRGINSILGGDAQNDFNGVLFYYDNPPLLPDSSGDTQIPDLAMYTTIPDADTIYLNLTPRFFFERAIDPGRQYYFKFSFDPVKVPVGNSTLPYDYNYGYKDNDPEPGLMRPVQPPLFPAVLEVRTW